MLMAQRSGAAIAPMYAASSHHWTAVRSWDRMEVPLPCSRVLFRFGPLWRRVADYVSGMTDQFALATAKRLKGAG
jgi:lysophospholipid acyltransferase (LPLAT)-like uncharacterized protein